MQEIRKYLHRFPELSGKERATAAFICDKLGEIGVPKIHRNFSEHSIIAEYDFGKPGKTILFRCELDALPIQETNSFSYKSVKRQVSHKCGHDGHMVIMLGLAKKLISAKLPGKILLLFQSAEENGNGARAILRSKKMEEFNIDAIFALHNIPGQPTGRVLCKPGNFTPSVESLDIHLDGKTSHAGMPEKGVNPAGCVSEIVRYFGKLHEPKKESKDFFLSTPIQIKMGKPAYGISAGKAVVSYTFRAWEKPFFIQKKREIISELEHLIKNYPNLEYDLKWKLAFDANINNFNAFQTIKEASEENNLEFIEMEHPFTFGEDFGYLTQKYNGAMFGLGAGEKTSELHNPDYDFPDELHEKGVSMFFSIAKKALLKGENEQSLEVNGSPKPLFQQ